MTDTPAPSIKAAIDIDRVLAGYTPPSPPIRSTWGVQVAPSRLEGPFLAFRPRQGRTVPLFDECDRLPDVVINDPAPHAVLSWMEQMGAFGKPAAAPKEAE